MATFVFASTPFSDAANRFFQRACSRPERTMGIIAFVCDLRLRVDDLEDQTESLRHSEATMTAAISDLQQRVAALEGQEGGCVQPPQGLVSWWPGDGNANDITGGNSGVLNNGATFAPGKVVEAFSFDGIDDYVQAGTSGLPIGNNNRTIDLWVKINSFLDDSPDPHSPQEAFFAGYGNFGSSTQIYALGTAGNVLFFSQWGSAIFGPSLQTNRWYHVAVTNVGNSATLYLDGTVVATGNLNINTPSNTNFYIGKIPPPEGDIRRLDGLVDEVEVFNRALTSSEILAVFKAGNEGKCKPLLGLSDDFNGPNLNTDIWEVFLNGGTFSFENGFLVIPGGSAIPFFRAKTNPFPANGPFTVEFGIQYTSASPSGSGVALTFTQQGNSPNPSNYPIQFWQDGASGLSVVRFGLTVATLGGVNTNYHVVKFVYDGQKYLVYLDGNLVYTSPNSNIAGGLWFGHPAVSVDTPWTGFKLDYIRVTQP